MAGYSGNCYRLWIGLTLVYGQQQNEPFVQDLRYCDFLVQCRQISFNGELKASFIFEIAKSILSGQLITSASPFCVVDSLRVEISSRTFANFCSESS
ncbi:hypothetical protein WA026_022925 [Henosepilachna vigintioctopunctata]|uniref:Uncharacterized protein n=1 Tax=Henosepilachna vigintioctopunctata TaxID=420089 RepID=A0AAW1TYL6_9CUCU